MFRARLLTLGIGLLLFSRPAAATTFGALGDSLTDEYLGNTTQLGSTDLPALNWLQLLVQLRGLDFGALEPDYTVRGEPRNEGYEHNWARSGAGALPNPLALPFASVTDQAAGIAPAVTAGLVDVVFLAIGSNDYFFRELLGGTMLLTDPGYMAFEDSILAAVAGAVMSLQAAGPADIVLALVPPGTAGGADPDTVAAIANYNARLVAEAAILGVPVFDMFDWVDDPGRVSGTDLNFAGHTIPQASEATLAQAMLDPTPGVRPCDSLGNCATKDYALNFTASDGIHPNTIVQGLIANEFLEAVNPLLASPIALLSDAEILAAAVPEPGIATLLAFGVGGWILARTRRR